MVRKSFETTVGEKHRCRLDIVEQATAIGIGIDRPARILTLPSREHLCYDLFRQTWPASRITCLERDGAIARELNNSGIHTLHTTTSDFLSRTNEFDSGFNIVFLDYFTFITKGVLDDLTLLIDGNEFVSPMIDPAGAIIAITLLKTVRAGNERSLDELSVPKHLIHSSHTESRCTADWIKGRIQTHMYRRNHVLLPIIARSYRADEGSSDMLFLLFYVH